MTLRRNFERSLHAAMQQNQRLYWALMSRLYLTILVFELHFELGNFLFKPMRSPKKNLVPPSHFHPLWNISIAEAAPRQKWYGLWKMIPFFFWAQMWTQNQLRSFEGLCSWLRVFWSPEEKQLDAITRRNFKRCNKFERIPLSTVKSLAPKQNIFTPFHIFLFMPLSF